MRTLTKEWLLKTIAELEEERDAVPGAVNEDAAMALAAMKIALASLEAEPVGYVDTEYSELLKAGHIESCSVYAEPGEGCCTVYTAPPAPVSVPDEIESTSGSDYDDYYCDGWNACRAAMLQGAEHVSNRDELTEGWVACSERMPEDEQEVITHNIFGYRHVSFFDEHSGNFFDRLDGSPVDCVEHVLVSHWMPMPAAPQQVAK